MLCKSCQALLRGSQLEACEGIGGEMTCANCGVRVEAQRVGRSGGLEGLLAAFGLMDGSGPLLKSIWKSFPF